LRAQRSNPDCFRGGTLDCFVASAQNCLRNFVAELLAMTEYDARASLLPRASRLQTCLFGLAARFARALLHLRTLKSKRAQGRPGADWHPRSAARNAHAGRTAQQHTGGADHSAFPARWSDGLCRALPGAELSFGLPRRSNWMMPSTRLGSRTSSIRLDRSNDGQDHTVLPYARPAISPAVFPAPSTRPETYRRDEA